MYYIFIFFLDCDLGKYGFNCELNCSCNVQNIQFCNNVDGSCICKIGWKGVICIDNINECLNFFICFFNFNCIDLLGFYLCDCIVGYFFVGGQCVGKFCCFFCVYFLEEIVQIFCMFKIYKIKR